MNQVADLPAVKFQPDRLEGVNAVHAYTTDSLTVNGQLWRESIVVPWQGEVRPWSGVNAATLNAEHFERLVAYRPELVIYGSGANLKFPPPALVRALIDARIGLETMDTLAACRTYNILASEGRRVLAALRLD